MSLTVWLQKRKPKHMNASKRLFASNSIKQVLRNPRSVVVNVLDCDIVVTEFVLQSSHYVYFQTHNLEKGMKTLSPLAMG